MAAATAQLSSLGQERAASAGEAVRALAPATAEPAPCTTVSLDFETLMRDLDTLYSKYSRMDRVNKVPIYNVQKDVMNMSHSPFPWWKPLSTYTEMVNFPQPVLPTENCQGNQKLLSLLHDFVADQKSQKTIMEDWKKMEESKKKVANTKKETKSKMTRRGRDSVQKMKERREIRKYKQFLLKEIVKKGETHYYLMKKEIAEPQNVEVEDLFEDWKHNLTPIKRPRKLTPRARKISHRAERKEMLKEEKSASERVQGPLTYCQMLKKNLKLPQEGPEVEEMFGPWMKTMEKLYKPSKATNAADEVEVFNAWNFIFAPATAGPPLSALECGQPTVATVPSKKPNKRQAIEKLSAKLLAEGYPLGNTTKADKPVEAKGEKKQDKVEDKSKALVVRAKTEVVPYVERRPLLETVERLAPAAKGFQPSKHSQRNVLTNDVPVKTFIGPVSAPRVPTPPPMPSFNWAELLATTRTQQSGRGEAAAKSYKREEIFEQWRHIFIEANKAPAAKPKMTVKEYKEDTYFMEWLGNLEEPKVEKVRKISGDTNKENKTPSPRASKKAERKQVREQFIDDDMTEIKDNRRNAFHKNEKIKEKKRTEASRNSLNKRVK